MYIDEKRFGALLKEAYNSTGVTILRTEEALVMTTACWEAEFNLGGLPKKMHAAIVKVTGWLPDVDEAYEYRKEHPRRSVMMETVRHPSNRPVSQMEVAKTPILLEIPHNGCWSILQGTDGWLCGVPKEMLDVVNRKKLEPGEELPKMLRSGTDIIWQNEYATLVMPTWQPASGSIDDDVMDALEMMGQQITQDEWSDSARWERNK